MVACFLAVVGCGKRCAWISHVIHRMWLFDTWNESRERAKRKFDNKELYVKENDSDSK